MTIKITGLTEITAKLTNAEQSMRNPRGVFPVLAEKMKQQVAQNFQRQTDPTTGAKWPPLSGLTTSLRPGATPLRATGQLLRSYQSARPNITEKSVSIGTSVVYAGTMQAGATLTAKRAKNMAMPLTKEAKRAGSARRWMEQNKSKGAFFYMSKAGSKFLAIAKKKGRGKNATTEIVNHWLLKESVKVPARPHLGFNRNYLNELAAIVVSYFAPFNPGGSQL